MSHSLLPSTCLAVLLSLVPMSTARAAPIERDERSRLEDAVADGDRDAEELASFRYAPATSPLSVHASSYVAIEGFGGTHRDGGRELGALLVVQLPLARWGVRATQRGEAPRAALFDGALSRRGDVRVASASVKPSAFAQDARATVATEGAGAPVVTLDVARSCVRAAWRAVGVADDTRGDSLVARARWSATLPELRLRVMRSIDESGRLSVSGEDPTHYTAVGAASNWLEARLTFRLDRLLFADEEMAVERLRAERAELRARTAAKALQALFEWQRAFALTTDASLSVAEHVAGVAREVEASAILDVVTDGWFARYRATLGEPRL